MTSKVEPTPEEFEDQAEYILDPEVQQKLEWLSPNQHRLRPFRHYGRRAGGKALTGKALVGKITDGKITNGKITNGEFADFFQGVSLTGNSDSVVSDCGCTKNTSPHAHVYQSCQSSKCTALVTLFTCTIRACGSILKSGSRTC